MDWNGEKIGQITFLALFFGVKNILAKNCFLPEMVWNGEKMVKSLFVKDQGSIWQFVLVFLIVQSEMSTVVR